MYSELGWFILGCTPRDRYSDAWNPRHMGSGQRSRPQMSGCPRGRSPPRRRRTWIVRDTTGDTPSWTVQTVPPNFSAQCLHWIPHHRSTDRSLSFPVAAAGNLATWRLRFPDHASGWPDRFLLLCVFPPFSFISFYKSCMLFITTLNDSKIEKEVSPEIQGKPLY